MCYGMGGGGKSLLIIALNSFRFKMFSVNFNLLISYIL